MMRFILAATLTLGLSSFATAGELDNESKVTNKELQGTMVLRVDTRTNQAAFVKLDSALASEADAKALAQSAQFSPVPAANVKSELDKDGGASSWYFYIGYPGYGYGYGYPGCNWYGNYYNPYYYYGYGNYNYYYYGSSWSYYR